MNCFDKSSGEIFLDDGCLKFGQHEDESYLTFPTHSAADSKLEATALSSLAFT